MSTVLRYHLSIQGNYVMQQRQQESASPSVARQTEAPIAEATSAAHCALPTFVASAAGGDPHPQAPAVALTQASGGKLARAGASLLQLQRAHGNRYVQQVVDHARTAPLIQPKLLLGSADDEYEREADRVARQVVNQGQALQRQRDEDEDEEVLMRKPDIQRMHSAADGAVDAEVQQAIQQAR